MEFLEPEDLQENEERRFVDYSFLDCRVVIEFVPCFSRETQPSYPVTPEGNPSRQSARQDRKAHQDLRDLQECATHHSVMEFRVPQDRLESLEERLSDRRVHR